MRPKTSYGFLAAIVVLTALPASAGIGPDGRELRVNRRVDFKQLNPTAAFSPGSGAVIAWENDQRGLRALFYGANGWPAGAEVTLVASEGGEDVPYTGPAMNPRQPAATFLRNGELLVAWTEERSLLHVVPFLEQREIQDQDIVLQRFSSTGAPLGERVQVNTTDVGFQQRARLVALQNGFLVTWEDGGTGGILGRRLDASGQPIGSEFAISLGSGARAALAVNAQGKVLVAWEGDDGGDGGVFARLLDANASPLGAPFRVNATTLDRQSRPAVAPSANDFLVAWQSEHEEIYSGFFYLYGRTVSANGTLAAKEVRLYSGGLAGGAAQIAPALVSLPGGGFLLSWLTWNKIPGAHPFALAALELKANLSPAGAAFWVAPGNVHRPFRSLAVATTGAGRFFTAWESPSASRLGISARRLISSTAARRR